MNISGHIVFRFSMSLSPCLSVLRIIWHLCLHVCVCILVCTYMFVYVDLCPLVCVCVCVYLCVCVSVCLCVCVLPFLSRPRFYLKRLHYLSFSSLRLCLWGLGEICEFSLEK